MATLKANGCKPGWWMVTAPRLTSTLADVMFEVDGVEAIVVQVRGGMDEHDEPALHTSKREAMVDALDRFKRLWRSLDADNLARHGLTLENERRIIEEQLARTPVTFEHVLEGGRVIRVTVPENER